MGICEAREKDTYIMEKRDLYLSIGPRVIVFLLVPTTAQATLVNLVLDESMHDQGIMKATVEWRAPIMTGSVTLTSTNSLFTVTVDES